MVWLRLLTHKKHGGDGRGGGEGDALHITNCPSSSSLSLSLTHTQTHTHTHTHTSIAEADTDAIRRRRCFNQERFLGGPQVLFPGAGHTASVTAPAGEARPHRAKGPGWTPRWSPRRRRRRHRERRRRAPRPTAPHPRTSRRSGSTCGTSFAHRSGWWARSSASSASMPFHAAPLHATPIRRYRKRSL